jgi:hypothetical protein
MSPVREASQAGHDERFCVVRVAWDRVRGSENARVPPVSASAITRSAAAPMLAQIESNQGGESPSMADEFVEDPLSAAVSTWSKAMAELLSESHSDVHGIHDHSAMLDAAYSVSELLKLAKAGEGGGGRRRVHGALARGGRDHCCGA